MLSPLGEAPDEGPFQQLALASLALYPEWIAALAEETGRSVDFRECGRLLVAQDQAEVEQLQSRLSWQDGSGLGVEWVDEIVIGEGNRPPLF